MNRYFYHDGNTTSFPASARYMPIVYLKINSDYVFFTGKHELYLYGQDTKIVWNLPDDWLLINKLKDNVKLIPLLGECIDDLETMKAGLIIKISKNIDTIDVLEITHLT